MNNSGKTYSNVFTVPNKDGISSETLKAVSLSFTHTADVNYKIEVYTDLKTKNPYSGTKQEKATVEDSTTYAGLYTIELNDTVELKPGSSFAVVVTTDKYALDYEQGINWESNGTKVWDAPVSLGGEKSFYGNNYFQTAWHLGNFCIKAFTTNNYKQKKDISNAVITKNDDFSPDNLSVNVTYDNVSLKQDVDYTLTSTNDENGVTVTINGQGDYTGTASKEFIPISSLNIKCKDVAYTGNEVKPEVTIKSDVGTLTENVDYSLSYSNNKNAGEDAVVTIKGLNNYYGTKDVKFQIYNDIGDNFTAFSLLLNGLIEFNVYIELEDDLKNDPDAYVLFTLPDGRGTMKQYVKDAKYQEGYGYIFTCGIYSREITKKISFQVFNGKGIGGIKNYQSVEDYTNVSLNSDREQSIKVRPLIKSLLNYGGYSQALFNYNLDDMAYKNVKDELTQSMNEVTADQLSNYKVISNGEQSGVNELGLALVLDSATSLRYYFKIDSSIDLSELDIKIDDKDCELKKDSNGYYLEVSSIPSNKLDKVHTFKLGDTTIKCSALSYVYSSLKNATNQKGMMASKALYLYWKESKSYFG